MKWLKDNWVILLWAMTTIGGGIAYYTQSEIKTAKLEDRTFDTVQQKVKVVETVENGLTAEQIQRNYILDSINKSTAVEFRARATKVFDEWEKSKKYQDSIALLNADQMYQIKEELKALKNQ